LASNSVVPVFSLNYVYGVLFAVFAGGQVKWWSPTLENRGSIRRIVPTVQSYMAFLTVLLLEFLKLRNGDQRTLFHPTPTGNPVQEGNVYPYSSPHCSHTRSFYTSVFDCSHFAPPFSHMRCLFSSTEIIMSLTALPPVSSTRAGQTKVQHCLPKPYTLNPKPYTLNPKI